MLAERPNEVEVSAIMDARNRLFQFGPKALSGSELVAIVLGTGAIGNAFEVSRQMVNQHCGLLGVAQLALTDLKEHDGMGLMKAMQLQAAIEIGSRLHVERIEQFNPRLRIHTPAEAAQFILMEMSLLEREHVKVMLLDTRGGLQKIVDLYQGTVCSVNMNVGEVFRDAIRHDSTAIIVAHNHPSGDPTPTPDDIQATNMLIKAGRLLDIDLSDHLVIGGGNYVSLRELGQAFETLDDEDKPPAFVKPEFSNVTAQPSFAHVHY